MLRQFVRYKAASRGYFDPRVGAGVEGLRQASGEQHIDRQTGHVGAGAAKTPSITNPISGASLQLSENPAGGGRKQSGISLGSIISLHRCLRMHHPSISSEQAVQLF
jgi:hypothetical protein